MSHRYSQKPLTVSSTWVKHLSLCQPLSLHFPISPPSLFQSVVAVLMENNLRGMKNMSHFSPKSLCASLSHKQEESVKSVVYV